MSGRSPDHLAPPDLPGGGPWPAGYLGAVTLSFDDGHPSQLTHALPILDEYDLKGTFYLYPRGNTEGEWRDHLAPWVSVSAAGHEIGNHSLSHACSEGARDAHDPTRPCLERWTLADVEADVLEAERRLNEVLPVPDGRQRTFCYPCYHEHVGRGATRQSYVPVIARHFSAGRGRGEFGENRPATCDLHYLWSWNVEVTDGAGMVGRAERASLGRWVVLTFHSFDGSWLSTSATGPRSDFRELCAYLARHRNRLWIAPIAEVAQGIRAWREREHIT
jgi:peptidoglycan-N-acetylglucosamine deacetylase